MSTWAEVPSGYRGGNDEVEPTVVNESERRLIIAIGRAARTCAMYRELLQVATRYGHAEEIERFTASLADNDRVLNDLIDQALGGAADTDHSA